MRPFRPGESLEHIISTAIPDFVESDYPLFVEFIKSFIRFLETERVLVPKTVYPLYGHVANNTIQETETYGGSVYEARKFLDYRDVATSLDEFTARFLAMFAKNFPQYSYIPADVLIQSLRSFYQSKGTAESIEWFFRAFFNEDAQVAFPREDILRASDGTWRAPLTLKVSEPIADPVTGIVPAEADVATFYTGQRIQTSTGSALVESVHTTVVGQAFNRHILVNELTLKFGTALGTFSAGQTIHNVDSDTQVYTVILPVISEILVESGGSNYLPGDLVSVSEGPTGGGGYGALGTVAAVASQAINGVEIIDGGDGYTVGLPVNFTSTSGSGAAAQISKIIFGNILLEDGTGYLLAETATAADPDYLILEDRNTILLGLSIDPFVNSTATVTLDSPDYGAATGVAAFDGLTLDSAIEIALAAGSEKPFMHPWVFTNPAHTTVDLANVAVTLSLVSNTFFAAGVRVFAIDSPIDVTTNLATSNITANVIVSNLQTSALYLKNVAGIDMISTGNILKATGNGTSQIGTIATLDGSSNVVGTNTSFTSVLSTGTHVRFADGNHYAVRSIVNNTFFEAYTPISGNLSANTWSTIPVGTITATVFQSQVYYGKIREISMLSTGDHYTTLPLVTAESVSAEAQAIDYLDPDPSGNTANNHIVASNGQISIYRAASLEALQALGQVTKIRVVSSGVNYTDANNISILVIHGSGRTGTFATAIPVLGALTQYPGYFTTSRGFLSADKYLEDADYYNNYTYVVRVAESFDRYRALLLQLIHPAGFKAVGRFVETETVVIPNISVDESLTIA